MNSNLLIASAPAELMLGLGIFFGLAAWVLLSLAAESGNYPEFTQWLREIHGSLPWNRQRSEWWLDLGARGDYCSRCGLHLYS